MEIIPAIDIFDKKCVRLTKGKFNDITIYKDPILFAKELEDRGAKVIHLCDLNRSKDNSSINSPIIEQIIKNAKIDIQLVGGIKNITAIQKYANLGVKKIIMSAGTILAMEKSECDELLRQYRSNIIVSIDGLGNKLVRNAWQDMTNIDLVEATRTISAMGISEIIYTDVARDGTLTEPNYLMVQKIMTAAKASITVAGGISLVAQIIRLKEMNVKGVIIGKALFYRNFNFEEALKIC
jgi:phosphoribosylformimino-5-aminoimidazole carboxamide ribotide isomerase